MSITTGPTGTIPYLPSCLGRTTYDMTQEMVDDATTIGAINEKFRGSNWGYGWAMLLDSDEIRDFEFPDGRRHVNDGITVDPYKPLAGRKPLPSEV